MQAEDGIRDVAVTGVQTCALPICPPSPDPSSPILVQGALARVGRVLPRPSTDAPQSVRESFAKEPGPALRPLCAGAGRERPLRGGHGGRLPRIRTARD